MEERGIPAGSAAIMKGDRVVMLRGYGFSDRERTRLTAPDALFRLASNDKLITKAAMKMLCSQGRRVSGLAEELSLSTLVVPFLTAVGVDLGHSPTDPRVMEVTIDHLLEHTSGLAQGPGPEAVAAALGIPLPPTAGDLARWLISQPLAFAPGERSEYNNAAYALARFIIDWVTGDFIGFLKQDVLASAGADDVAITRDLPEDRDPREPWYSSRFHCLNVVRPVPRNRVWFPDGCMNLRNDLVLIASAEAAVRFLRRYHVGTGTPLIDLNTGEWAPIPDNGLGLYFGSMAGTFTITIQRRYDEVNIAVLFNQREEDPERTDYGVIWESLMSATDKVTDWP